MLYKKEYNRIRVLLLVAVCLVLSQLTCGTPPTEAPTATPEATKTPEETKPTKMVKPTEAVEPTEVIVATKTAEPTETTEPTVAAPSSATCVTEESPIAPYALPDLPPVTAEDWSRGPETARITLIVYSDYQ